MNELWLRLQQKLSADYEQYITDMMAKEKNEIIKNAEPDFLDPEQDEGVQMC